METLRKRLLEPGFKYTKAGETDVRKTFARIRRQLAEQAKAPVNVCPIKKAKS